MRRALARLNGADRLGGIDLARGLAVIGMLAAHLLTIEEPFDLTRPQTWLDIVNGRSSILFAVLAATYSSLVLSPALYALIKEKWDAKRAQKAKYNFASEKKKKEDAPAEVAGEIR